MISLDVPVPNVLLDNSHSRNGLSKRQSSVHSTAS